MIRCFLLHYMLYHYRFCFSFWFYCFPLLYSWRQLLLSFIPLLFFFSQCFSCWLQFFIKGSVYWDGSGWKWSLKGRCAEIFSKFCLLNSLESSLKSSSAFLFINWQFESQLPTAYTNLQRGLFFYIMQRLAKGQWTKLKSAPNGAVNLCYQ